MSKLIEALNRLQSLKDEDPLAAAHSSEPATDAVSPPSPISVARSTAVPKKSYARKPEEKERPLFNMAANDWLGVLQQEYLKNFIREGGGAIKVGVFPDQGSLQGFQQALVGMANTEA
jgi:hypothetical protein